MSRAATGFGNLADPLGQYINFQGFQQKKINSQGYRPLDDYLLVERCQYDDFGLGFGGRRHFLQHSQSVQAGYHQIQQYHVRLLLFNN